MLGLDRQVINSIDHESVIEHIKMDARSDFIVAPHYDAIFRNVGDELWFNLRELLRSGNYRPALPHTINVPKKNWFTRPGSILNPFDRFLYQALADKVSQVLEHSLDRERCFSNVLSDRNRRMFEPQNKCYAKFQRKIGGLCENASHILKIDISNFFERIPHHPLINSMSAVGCPGEIVNLLEKMLLAFRERRSFGIVQGLYPSDVLGNFFLSDIDAYLTRRGIPSARYVDDIFLSFESELAAKKGLADLTERLRKDGLNINETKSRILPSDEVLLEKTEVDRMFAEAVAEVEAASETESAVGGSYAFEDWQIENDPESEESLVTTAVKHLFAQLGSNSEYDDRIEKFCLPFLRKERSDIAVDHVCENLLKKPYQSRLYFSYLAVFVRESRELVRQLEKLLSSEELITDYQKMFLLKTLGKATKIRKKKIDIVLEWFGNGRETDQVRAVAAVLVAMHGTAFQKKEVKLQYHDQQSEYVRAAILYASRFFTPAEKRNSRIAWQDHSVINSLVAKAI